MKLAILFFALHVIVKVVAIFGITFAMQHPAQFASDPTSAAVYVWAIQNVGAIDILTGTLAMLAFGIHFIGMRATVIFFVASTVISAAAELTGTKTGWPFGGYEYTDFLGYKMLGRVPYTIPLSWFYMGFAGYLLGAKVVQSRGLKPQATLSILFGAWLLMAWDLVLDPAMASPRMTSIHFWIWNEHGAYFGMPLRNFAGWFGTGLFFIAAARLAWRREYDLRTMAAWFPFIVYTSNVIWAMALSLSVGLWETVVAALVLSLFPAALAFLPASAPPAAPQPPLPAPPAGYRPAPEPSARA
jgi:putative membrane protein